MIHYNYGVLVNVKQKEIEKKSSEAWKFSVLNQDSLLSKMLQKFSFIEGTKTEEQKNNCIYICES
jgi:hypothetical protein